MFGFGEMRTWVAEHAAPERVYLRYEDEFVLVPGASVRLCFKVWLFALALVTLHLMFLGGYRWSYGALAFTGTAIGEMIVIYLFARPLVKRAQAKVTLRRFDLHILVLFAVGASCLAVVHW